VARKRSAWELFGTVVSAVGAVLTMIASFFLAGEDYYPGAFYIQRQALWDDGRYGVKLTFLLTWFTLLDLVLIPVLVVAGVVALGSRLTVLPRPAPPGWDLHLVGHRVKMGLIGFVLLPIWLAVTAVVIFWPERFSPLGGLASILLLILPTLPMLGPALLFEAVIPPSYVEGAVEGMHYVTNRNRTTVHLHVAGRTYTTGPTMVQGLREGSRVGLVATGFFKTVRRLAPLAAAILVANLGCPSGESPPKSPPRLGLLSPWHATRSAIVTPCAP